MSFLRRNLSRQDAVARVHLETLDGMLKHHESKVQSGGRGEYHARQVNALKWALNIVKDKCEARMEQS